MAPMTEPMIPATDLQLPTEEQISHKPADQRTDQQPNENAHI